MATRHFPIREVDRRVFEALRDGAKTVETRAGSPRYQHVQAGEEAVFDCGADRVVRKIIAVRHFKTIHELVEHYDVEAIVPWLHTEQELVDMYMSFPGYRERIAQYGIIAMELAK